ncbi:MAG: lytic transglycosylase domain-containing protein [Bacteroidota bacterium]|nr:lytic transglycosylase domain-containing protein [Bacteroidota bacterium]
MFIFSKSLTRNDDNYRKAFYKGYKIFAVEIPDKLDFAGENVPLNNYYVREALDRELLLNTYFQSQTLLMFKRANRWFPFIEPILKKNGIPDDFKYLALIESTFANNFSSSGAGGYWQFMKETGKRYGLEVTEEVDERFNVEKATEAACKYLKELYNINKSWTLAAASYNVGEASLSKSIKTQRTLNYYDLYLNQETSRYIFRILSAKLIISNPRNYGYYLRKKDLYPPIPTVFVNIDSSISDLPGFAIKYKISYRILKELNPWLRKTNLPNPSKKRYNILIPKEGYTNYDLLMKGIEDEPFQLIDTIK